MIPSLQGLRILNTRPKDQAQTLSKTITEAQGVSVECPTIEIQAMDNQWMDLLPDLNTVHYALFVSANAVHHCFSQLNQNTINWPNHIKVIAIGKGTARALKAYTIQISDVPEVADSEHLLTLSALQQIKDRTVLLFKGEGGRSLIEKTLIQREAIVLTFSVYQRVMPAINPDLMNSLWCDDLVDIILLTSEQSIQNLFQMFAKEAHQWLNNKPCVVISDRLANSASLYGMKQIITCHPESMLPTLLDYAEKRNREHQG